MNKNGNGLKSNTCRVISHQNHVIIIIIIIITIIIVITITVVMQQEKSLHITESKPQNPGQCSDQDEEQVDSDKETAPNSVGSPPSHMRKQKSRQKNNKTKD